MQIIQPSATYLARDMSPFKFIEFVGRTCYKSTDKITDDSAPKFVNDLRERGHTAMLEHHWPHLILHSVIAETLRRDFHEVGESVLCSTAGEFDLTQYIRFSFSERTMTAYISAPLTAFLTLDDLILKTPFMTVPKNIDLILSALAHEFPSLFRYNPAGYLPTHCSVCNDSFFFSSLEAEFNADPCIYARYKHELMKHTVHSVHFICDRGVTHEMVRHRPPAFAQESTRYCNYQLDKFGGEITVIEPFFFTDKETPNWDTLYPVWREACESAERGYFKLLDAGAKPQEARSVLPTCVKTEIVITANELEWQHIVNLRFKGTTGAPHPQMKEVMSYAVPALVMNSNGRIVA